jgi:2-polyprenyl-6-methoxyphenol hydroxylase-like FAD-dependent oxidoreductase
MSDDRTDVLVVGAGPTGLLLAVELVRRQVPCVLIDLLDAPQGWDRATVVHERSLQIFEALGIADPLIEAGVKTRGARFHSGGEVLAELSLDLTGSRYGFQLGVSEEATEAVLTEYLEALGGSVTRSTRLTGLRPEARGVTATVEHDGQRREIVADWVVGCDGYHSAVREAAGIAFPGADIEVPWAVFDATLEGWNSDYENVFAFLDQPPLIITPLPERRWRAYLRPASADSDLVVEASDVLRRYVPEIQLTDIASPTRFHCHSRVATSYRSGRVLLAGDAAHACTPAEGHGMNTGLQDAFNLGWKLALVCRGEAGEGLLDTYEAERLPVAELVVSSGANVEVAHAMTDAGERAARDAQIRQTISNADTAHHEAAAASELDRVYPMSRAVMGDDGATVGPGRLLPDTANVEPADGEPRPLHELTHRTGHTLIVLGGRGAVPGLVGDVVAELQSRAGTVVDAVIGLCTRPDGGAIGRIDDSVAARHGVYDVTILAVRPDRYIGLRDDSGDPRAVDAYLDGLLA